MKALVLEEHNRLAYRDFPDPTPGPDEVLVQVEACGICGSDVHGMDVADLCTTNSEVSNHTRIEHV